MCSLKMEVREPRVLVLLPELVLGSVLVPLRAGALVGDLHASDEDLASLVSAAALGLAVLPSALQRELAAQPSGEDDSG